jgi:hypothetical protein
MIARLLENYSLSADEFRVYEYLNFQFRKKIRTSTSYKGTHLIKEKNANNLALELPMTMNISRYSSVLYKFFYYIILF